jgi:NADPH2:quinone reductase
MAARFRERCEVKAIWYESIGPAADVLEFGEMPTPHAGPGEVRVRLEASGVNPADVARRGGGSLAMEHPRVIPNSDGAGIVDQVGAGVTRFREGDRVWLFNGQRNGRAFGTAAQYIALAEHLVTKLPDQLTFAQGATLGIPAMTAWCCLFGSGSIRGKTVLVTGGAGAVGHYAVQLAKWGGARVIATVSSEAKADHATRGGADAVIHYRSEDVAARAMALTEGCGVDLVVDVDFGGNLAATMKAMALHGEIVFYASNGNRAPLVAAREIMEKCLTIRALVLYAVRPEILRAAQDDIMAWIAGGPRMHSIASTYPLAQTAEAHRAVERGDKLGTVVVECAR